ncbi:MAG: acetylornithine deacetylase [Bacteroidetes bacterium]|nr:MAG: acetylornithine deacetylase [Bacteroidota bacterium]
MPAAKDILAQLVAFPVLGGQSNLSIVEYLKSYLSQYGVSWQLVPNPEGNKASLHCRIGPAVDGGVILSGHTDVVPVEGQPWETDPFVLTEKDGKLYGRGSCDMKGFLACCLACIPDMVKAQLKKPIYFAFSYDEEIGCLAAPELVAHIQQSYTEKPRFAIIGEPSLMEPIVGQKGICIFHTTVNGSAGHSSRIRQEVSAIHESMRLILWLENKMDALIQAGHIDARFTPNHTSIHIGKIQGGIAPNVIADHCSFFWDCRTIPQDNVHEIRRDFDAYCREREAILRKVFPDFRILTEEHHPAVPPLDTPAHFPIVELVKRLSGKQKLNAVSYAAEAGQFAQGGFESIICGPGSIEQAHRANEFIAIEQLEKGVAFIRKLVKEMENEAF